MKPLDGLRIVVTRPAAQAGALADMIRGAGGVPVLFPTIDIAALSDLRELDAALDALATFDLAIFVSANAVQQTFARLHARGLSWPAQMRTAATGPATASMLASQLPIAAPKSKPMSMPAPALTQQPTASAQAVIHPPARFDSEGLIAELARLKVAPQRVLIVRGTGGREWLLDHFTDAGVAVQTVATYTRLRGTADPAPLLEGLRQGQIAALTVTSSEGGENLIAMLANDVAAVTKAVPVFVPHARIAARMRALDCARVVETAGGDAGLMAGLTAHFAPHFATRLATPAARAA